MGAGVTSLCASLTAVQGKKSPLVCRKVWQTPRRQRCKDLLYTLLPLGEFLSYLPPCFFTQRNFWNYSSRLYSIHINNWWAEAMGSTCRVLGISCNHGEALLDNMRWNPLCAHGLLITAGADLLRSRNGTTWRNLMFICSATSFWQTQLEVKIILWHTGSSVRGEP